MGETHILNTSQRLTLLTAFFRPLAWLCLRRSYYIQDAIEALKIAFIEVSRQELIKRGEKVNTSRLSALTGLRRREVTRLYLDNEPKTVALGLVTKIIGLWMTGADFTTGSGKPKTLEPSQDFAKLVREISNDLHPGTILFELERLGLVKSTKFGVKLIRTGFMPSKGSAAGYHLLAEDFSDLSEAAVQNIEANNGQAINPHAKTFFDNIDRSTLPKIRTWLLRENLRIHKRLRDYLSQFDLDICHRKEARGGARVAFGTFGIIQEHKEGKDEKN